MPKGLAVHVITDNYATRGQENVVAWLAKHPRFHFHFTPTSSCWLNLVERWFRELTQKAIQSQYTSEDFAKLLKDNSVAQSFSRPAQ